ncbi:protein FAM163A [Clupea harengus]|uniref:Protein FAM163A n=1 Tax=Clupea harengus TaxID=7950 RepID=A0A6P8G6Q3_CLUHA|nr:protein FAM163A [Clupea harengus]XP_031430961.1 protein FAM163A [Clupea harengus]
MTAGTVVITGGILATVILLFIIAVLCYCRLQYYCCKKNESEGEAASVTPSQHACNECNAPGLDGSAATPLSLSPEPVPSSSYCPSCSPYGSPFYVRSTGETRNGGERITYMPTHFENPSLSLPLPKMHCAPLSSRNAPDFYTNRRAISTDV